jgi:hypothetical protein
VIALAILLYLLLAITAPRGRLRLVLVAPLLVLDAAGNVLIGGSWRNTLSGEAHAHRTRRWWGWTETLIDGLFFWQVDHCKAQAERERQHGSVWAAWAADWNLEN